jgi:hypothetical protein
VGQAVTSYLRSKEFEYHCLEIELQAIQARHNLGGAGSHVIPVRQQQQQQQERGEPGTAHIKQLVVLPGFRVPLYDVKPAVLFVYVRFRLLQADA